MSSIRESKEDWFRESKEYSAQCIIGRDEATPGKLQILSPAEVSAMLGVSGTSWGSITGTLSAQTDLQDALDDKADVSSLAAVALSGAYSDLSGLPTLITAHSALSGLEADDHTQYHNDARALTWLGTRSTSDLPENTNLYFTDERAQDATGAMATDGSLVYVDATPLLTRGALTGDITASQGSNATTLATVNANVGSFGSATQVGTFTVNAKGLITAAGNTTITPAASSITSPQALTRTNDTNVTLTLGGTPTTALLQATSITVGWSGVLAETRGGTNQSTYAQGDLLYASAANRLSKLAKDTNATRYLSNTGASNNPAWAQINLANGVTGRLPFANLTQGSARSVLGVTGNATANVASIQGTANQALVVNSAGTALAFGQVNLASSAAVTGDLPLANLAPSSSASRLLGRGDASAGDYQEITLGAGLSMSGTTLTGLSIPSTAVYGGGSSTDNAITRWDGASGTLIQNSGVILSDADAMTGLASLTFDIGTDVNEFSTDGLLAGDSDDAVPTEKATKTYIDARALYKAPVSSRYYANHSTAMFPGTASVFGATGWVFFSAHNLSFPTTIDKVSFEVTTAVAASNGRVGIYSDVNGVPTSLIRDCGTISTASTGVKEITGLSQAIPAGRFWIGTQFDSAVSVRSWGTAVGHDINAEIGMAAFNNPVTANIDIFTTYAGGLPATATVLQFNGIDTIQTCWRS